jgi:hypothetical protein
MLFQHTPVLPLYILDKNDAVCALPGAHYKIPLRLQGSNKKTIIYRYESYLSLQDLKKLESYHETLFKHEEMNQSMVVPSFDSGGTTST